MLFHLTASKIVISPNNPAFITSTYVGPANETVTFTECRGHPDIIIINPDECTERQKITSREKDRLTRVAEFSEDLSGKVDLEKSKFKGKITQVVAEYGLENGQSKVRGKVSFVPQWQGGGAKRQAGVMTAETLMVNGQVTQRKIDIHDRTHFPTVAAVSVTIPDVNQSTREVTIHTHHRKNGGGDIHLVFPNQRLQSPSEVYISFGKGKRPVDLQHMKPFMDLYSKLASYSAGFGVNEILKATQALIGLVKKDMPLAKDGIPPHI